MFRISFRRMASASASLLLSAGLACAALPSPWLQTDIGSTGPAGSGSVTSGVFTVAGSGADVWGSADAFHFVYQRLNGNTQLVAKVTGVQNTNAWAKAGVMIREDLTPGSRNAFLLVSAARGAAFQSRATPARSSSSTVVTGVTAPFWIKLCRSGDNFTAFRSSDGVTWTLTGTARVVGMQPVVYAGLAVTSHNNSAKCTATFSNVQFLAPPALFVVGSASLNAGDAAAKKRLEALGYAVKVKTAVASVSGDANGKDLVVISSTVGSADVGTKFTSSAVPVVTWEQNLLGKLGMTGAASGRDFGTTASQTDADVYASACDRSKMYTAVAAYGDGCHDLTAGFSGTIPLLRAPGTVAWGKPGAAAVKVLAQSGNTGHALEFAYDKGAAMPGLAAAPARRVFLFMTDNSETRWSPRGQGFFDQAIYWATNTRYYVVKKALALIFDPVLRTQNGIRLHEWGNARATFWGGDPIVLRRDYFSDLTEGSGGYVRWKLAQYPDIPDLLDKWGPIVSNNATPTPQFNTAEYTEQQYLDAYQYVLDNWDFVGGAQRMPNGGNYTCDYNGMLDAFGVDAKVNAGEVDEVVVFNHPYSGMWESAMMGRTSFWINGSPVYRNTPNFFVMGYTYERTVGLATHAFGHRAEQLVGEHAYQTGATQPYISCYWPDAPAPNPADPANNPCPDGHVTPVVKNIYDRFTLVEGIMPGEAGVGAIHWPPNLQLHNQEYHYWETNPVYSMADDWSFNYPLLAGSATKRLVNVDEWTPMAQDGEQQRGFVKWFYHHMPRLPGHYKDANNAANNGKLNNWWEYIVNFNRHPETQH